MGIGTSFGTVPVLAVLFVPMCSSLGFSTPATILLISAAAALGLSLIHISRIRRPEVPIMPYSRNEIPPMTGPGIVWISAASGPTNEQMMLSTACLLYTSRCV